MRTLFCSALVAVVLAGCTTTETVPDNKPTASDVAPDGQLPEGVTPLRYSLDLEIDPRQPRFTGTVEILTRLDKPTDSIWLHGESLEIASAVVVVGKEEVPATWTLKGEHGVSQLKTTRVLEAGEVVLRIAYSAPFDANLKGLYKVEEGGESYAFTQFESHFARLAFPSFDEPRFKTRFDIAVTAKKGDVVVTATAERNRAPAGADKERIVFGTTEPLPTYLIAFAVGPMDVVEGKIERNAVRGYALPFRGLAAKGKGVQLKYAMEHTGPLLAELERYFGIPHPFEKLDIIAVPDFASGAMENVGAITFREWLLLLDEKSAPTNQKQAFAYVMAHELAHQWFGNLVTMPWWDDIWLNEAFATWMGSRVVENVHPEYGADVLFLERVHSAMRSDALVNARQIRNPVTSTHDIRNAFDSITYSKGGGVLAMFETWMGPDVFRKGLQNYMERHRFSSATYEDLLKAFSEASGKDVATPFKTFLFQPGVPLVEAKLECSDGGAKVALSQSRYLPVGSTGSRDQTWSIPVCARFSLGGEAQDPACTMLSEKTGSLDLKTTTCPDFVMPNAGGTSYYRWSMPAQDLDKLLAAKGALSPRERYSVADGLSASFDAAVLDAGEVMARLPAIASDEHRAVNGVPMRILSFARDHLAEDDERQQVMSFGRKLYTPWIKKLGMKAAEGDDADTRRMRARVVGFLAISMEDPAVLTAAAKLGRAAVGFGGDGKFHADAVDPDLVGVALAAAVQTGDAAFIEHLETLFAGTHDALWRGRILSAFASTRDPEFAARARALTLSEGVRGNEAFGPIAGLMSTEKTRASTWSWFKTNYESVLKKLPSTRTGRLPGMAAYFCDDAGIAEARGFFEERAGKLVGGPRNLKLGLERATLCAARRSAHQKSATRFFSSYKLGQVIPAKR